MTRTWATEDTVELQNGNTWWRGRRSDGIHFYASSREAFNKFLDSDCDCSLDQNDLGKCPVHKQFVNEREPK